MLLHLLHDEAAVEPLPQALERQPFLRQRFLERFVGQLVFLLDPLDRVLELVVAQVIPGFLAALEEQHLVHGAHEEVGHHLRQRLVQGLVLEVPFAGLLQRLNLFLLEVLLRERFAVHLHEHPLDDQARPLGEEATSGSECQKESEADGQVWA